MSEDVKQDGGRVTRRAEQAQATRRRIIDQAGKLFVEQGYAATTLDQIAAAAGVAVQTVYFHFRNKATVLKEVVDVLAVGDDEPVPMLDRPWVRRAYDEPDPRRAVAIWTRAGRSILERIAPMMKIVRDAAGSDPEMAAQWQANQQQTHLAQREFARRLASRHALRPHLSADRAADILFCMQSIEVYLKATTECGWTPSQWQRWVTESLVTTILL